MKPLPSPLIPSALIALALSVSTGIAQVPASPESAPGAATPTAPAAPAAKPKPLAEADKRFFKDASEAILFEQKLALMGTKEGKGEETLKAAKTINGDLTKVWEKLATLSMEKGATIAQEVSKADANKVQRIAKQKEEKFDKDLLDDLGKEAKKTTRIFENKALQDPDLKQFVSEWSPTIKGHEAAIDKAEKALGKKSR